MKGHKAQHALALQTCDLLIALQPVLIVRLYACLSVPQAYELLGRLKAHKAQYRLLHDSFRETRAAVETATYAVAEARSVLIAEFDRWCVEQGTPQVKYMQVRAGGVGRGAVMSSAESFVWSCWKCR